MGCVKSKEGGQDEKPQQKQVFSWDRDDRPDPKDYTISGQDGVTCGRKPGTINGQQFIIENCNNCNIYIYDHSAMVTIDKCENCVVFLAPVRGSVFIRNCKNIKCAVACQQFRTRDCQKIETFLYCQTQPIIELSSGMKFSCFQYYYPDLEEQFKLAGLSVYNNIWSTIHDFSPVDGSENWTLLPETTTLESAVPKPTTDEFVTMEIDLDPTKSVVPLTRHKRPTRFDESCLLVFFSNHRNKVKSFLSALRDDVEYDIIQCKEIKMSADDVQRVFKQDKYNHLCGGGPVIGFELNGASIILASERALQNISLSYNDVFLSKTNSATSDINAFYNFIDMAMVV